MADPSQTTSIEEQIARLKLQETELSLRKEKLALRTQKWVFAAAVLTLIGIAATTVWATKTKAATALGKDAPPIINSPRLAFFLHGIQAAIIFFFVRKHRQWLRRIAAVLHEKAPDAPIAKLIKYLEAAESGLLDVRALDDAKWVAVMKAAAGAS